MEYKILVTCKNTSLVADFIRNSDTIFNAISTSDYLPDVVGHFKFFKPDAFICFLGDDIERTISMLNGLKRGNAYNGAAIFIVAEPDIADIIEENNRFIANVIVRRPVTQDNLTLKITRYLEEIEEAKKKLQEIEEARKAKREENEKIAAKSKEEIAAKAKEMVAEGKEEAALSAKKAAGDEKKHILVVDDDRNVLKMLKSALSDKYDVTTVANGIVVGKFLESKSVDLIILDYEMPIETGADVFRKIKNNPKTSHIPVCFLTGVSEREKILEIMSLKPHGYLLKPIEIDLLMSTIRDLTS